MAFSTGYTLTFATAICVVCSLSIASVSIGLRDKQEANRRRDVQGNILGALGLPEDGHALAGTEIDDLYKARVEYRVVDPKGALIEGAAGDRDGDGDLDEDDVAIAHEAVASTDEAPELCGLYVRKDGANDAAFALPLDGKGLWGPISGYLALDAHGTEVKGVSFFAPKETPGLGAEITKAKFISQWAGKKVVDGKGAAKTIHVVKGEATVLCPGDTEHCVDGVSGATITSRGVDAMVAEALNLYDPYLKQLRGK